MPIKLLEASLYHKQAQLMLKALHYSLTLRSLNTSLSMTLRLIEKTPDYIPRKEFSILIERLMIEAPNGTTENIDFLFGLYYLNIISTLIEERAPKEWGTDFKPVLNRFRENVLGSNGIIASEMEPYIDTDFSETVLKLNIQEEITCEEMRHLLVSFFSEGAKDANYSYASFAPILSNKKHKETFLIVLLNKVIDTYNLLIKTAETGSAGMLFDFMVDLEECFAVIEKHYTKRALDVLTKGKLNPVEENRSDKHSYAFKQLSLLMAFYINDRGLINALEEKNKDLYVIYKELESVADDIEAVSTDSLHRMDEYDIPFMLKHILISFGENTVSAFGQLYEYFKSANLKADLRERYQTYYFFLKFQYAITFYLHVYQGENGIKHLSQMIFHTNKTMIRALKQVPCLQCDILELLSTHFKLSKVGFKDKQSLERFDQAMRLIFIINNLLESEEDESLHLFALSKMREHLAQGVLKDLVEGLQHTALSVLFQIIGIRLSEVKKESVQILLSEGRILRVAQGMCTIQESVYRELYKEQLKLFLRGGDFDSFIHDKEQFYKEGCQVAKINQEMRKALKFYRIKENAFLNYEDTKQFLFMPDMDFDERFHHAVLTLHMILTQLYRELNYGCDIAGDFERQISSIIKLYDNYHIILEKTHDKREFINELLSPHIRHYFLKIAKILGAINEKKSKLPSTFSMLIQQYLDVFTTIKKDLTSKTDFRVKRREMPHFFEIGMHDKSEFDTLFLGDEMSCCMATNGESFQSMVVTRSLDSMPIIAIRDILMNKPVALAWLYLAIKSNGKVALIAEYLEVSKKYTEPSLMKTLIYELLSFSERYYKSIGCLDGFYIGKHFYGVTEGGVDTYPLESVKFIDVLGGPLETNELPASDIDLTSISTILQTFYASQYMLLNFHPDNQEAHRFSPRILKHSKPKELFEPCNLIQARVLDAWFEGITERAAVKLFIIQKEGFHLAPFYQSNLLTDEVFEKQVRYYVNLTAFTMRNKGFFKSTPVIERPDVIKTFSRDNIEAAISPPI